MHRFSVDCIIKDVHDRRKSLDLPEWADEQCSEFLEKSEDYIRGQMCNAGWDAIGDLLDEDAD
jgi:hypothetical protein